jgi:hypothetical protein
MHTGFPVTRVLLGERHFLFKPVNSKDAIIQLEGKKSKAF